MQTPTTATLPRIIETTAKVVAAGPLIGHNDIIFEWDVLS